MPEDRELPARLTTPEVLALTRYSRPTLARRVAEGRMPQPIDRCQSGAIYNRDAVLKALSMTPEPVEEKNPWDIDEQALAEAFARKRPAPADRTMSPEQFALERERLNERARHERELAKAERDRTPSPKVARRKKAPAAHRPQTPKRMKLGRFVVIKREANGINRVYFLVPPKFRPAGWPATIPLPIDKPRTGNLGDAIEVARIKADADELNRSLARGDAEPTLHRAEVGAALPGAAAADGDVALPIEAVLVPPEDQLEAESARLKREMQAVAARAFDLILAEALQQRGYAAALAALLIKQRGSTVSRTTIYEQVFEYEGGNGPAMKSIDVTINRLRKLFARLGLEHAIETHFGVGYSASQALVEWADALLLLSASHMSAAAVEQADLSPP